MMSFKVATYCGITLIVFALHSCLTFRTKPRKLETYFRQKQITAIQDVYQYGFRDIHYVKTGDTLKPLILFVHGSPGSLNAFVHFLTDTILLNHAQLITVDRPGFGYSNFGNAEVSVKKQAEILTPLLKRYKGNRKVILVGHSLGAPVVARVAMDYPDLVDGLVLVAGSLAPELEPDETWFRAPLASPFLSWILPRAFRASNDEIYHLKPELEMMLPFWKNITCPVTVIQGNRDKFVSPDNASFAKKMIINAPLDLIIEEDMDHFVPWSHPQLIQQALLNQLRNIKTSGN
ncbi:alpha/beta fold hydrolase [Chryseosolibacter indicus]|uniref:Alpha/beta hydrolase n=1 Tax=Chryseosolibacter indicus TaxID=2782351 RepID=A0ABS5VXK0_9BACT|nr:alpha/beta hydrolase [Chryseosolibacter indicus]MBT1704716.1 alpha/beta hydrolase [Chryseosolibacter indicus]